VRPFGHSRADFAWSLDLLVDDLFAVADAAGLKRFHLVGESIGGTVALAAALARPERIATLTVSNAPISAPRSNGVEIWKRQLEGDGVKAWSDTMLTDRFHDDALLPERRAWFANQQEQWPRDSILNACGWLIGTDLHAAAEGHKVSGPAAASRQQPVHPVPVHWLSCIACCPDRNSM